MEAKNCLEDERREMTDKFEAMAHFESQIAEISQWYVTADVVYHMQQLHLLIVLFN